MKLLREAHNIEFDEEEFCVVGAGIGGGFEHTAELKMLKLDEAVNSVNKKNWYQTIEEEYERFEENKCFEEVSVNKVKPGTKIITSI